MSQQDTSPAESQPPSSTAPAASRRRLRKLSWWALAVGLLLLLLPEAVRLALIQAAPELGLGQAQIEDVDLNLFRGSVGIDGLELRREDETKLILNAVTVDVSWLKLLVGEVHIETATIDGLQLTAQQLDSGDWEVVIPLVSDSEATEPETADPQQETGELPKILLSHLLISNTQLTVESELVSGAFVIDALALEHVSTWQEAPLLLELKGHWREAPMALMVSAQPWIEQPQVKGELVLQGLPLAGIHAVPEVSLAGAVSSQLAFAVQLLPTGIQVSLQGELGLADLAAGYRNLALEQQQLSWDGDVALTVPTVEQAQLTYQLQGNLASQGLTLRDTQQEMRLLAWQSLAVQSLSADQTLTLGLEQLQLTAVDIMDDHLQTGELTIQQVQLEQANALRIASVQIDSGNYSLVLDEQGRPRVQMVLEKLREGLGLDAETADEAPAVAAEPEPAVPAATSGSTDPFRFSLDKLAVTGDTRIAFVDRRFSEPVEQTLTINTLQVNSLDQFNPQQATTLNLQGRIGEFSKLSVEGEGAIFAEPMSLAIDGKLTGMELPDLSPYSAAYIGYELTRGHYDHEFSVVIEQEEIDLKNQLHLRQLKLKSVDPDTPQPLERQLDLPLGVALDMLRDGDDNIDLEVPIHGRLDEPNININDIINDALGKALKKGATSYLTYALQPYGAILMAADMVGDQMNAVRLEPMTYSPGEADVPEQREYLDKLRGLLEERPKLHLSICGRSNQQDREALFGDDAAAVNETADAKKQSPVEQSAMGSEQHRALQQLAEQRAKNLKRLFVAEGLEGERVLLCQSRYEAEGISGVQLQM